MDNKLIDKYMNAALLIDEDLYTAAFKNTPAVYAILSALNNFVNPIL